MSVAPMSRLTKRAYLIGYVPKNDEKNNSVHNGLKFGQIVKTTYILRKGNVERIELINIKFHNLVLKIQNIFLIIFIISYVRLNERNNHITPHIEYSSGIRLLL